MIVPVDLGPSHAAQTRDRLSAVPGIRRVPSRLLDQFVLPGFLDAATCAALIERVEATTRPSTIADANGDPLFRTSSTGDLDHDDPVVAALDARLHDLLGIPAPFGEPLQGQRYAPGQEFKAHTDYFDPHGLDFHQYCAVAGQRTWTAMIYLDQPKAGGATRFLATGKLHHPVPGTLLAWANVRPDGMVNPDTLHHGMKVRSGVKTVITKWFRERPYRT